MLEATGRVVAVADGTAWVQTEVQSACGHCCAGAGCGTSALAGLLGRSRAPVPVDNSVGAAVGDELVLGIDEDILVAASVTVYLLPLLAMLLAALGAAALGWDESGAALCGLGGLVAGLYGVHWLARRTAGSDMYLPVVLRHHVVRNRYEIINNAIFVERRHD